ncbi:MAG: hypothetical protein WC564_04890 [Patescibacteria group bacterium]
MTSNNEKTKKEEERKKIKEESKVNVRKWWENFYRTCLKRSFDFSALDISDRYNPNKHICLIIPKGIIADEACKVLKIFYKINNHSLKDLSVLKNYRDTNKDYAVILNKNNVGKDLTLIEGFMLLCYLKNRRAVLSGNIVCSDSKKNGEGGFSPVIVFDPEEDVLHIDLMLVQ